MSHVYVGPHPDTLGDGTILAQGIDQKVKDLDLEDPHNQALVNKGWLIEVPAPKPKTPARSTTNKEAGK